MVGRAWVESGKNWSKPVQKSSTVKIWIPEQSTGSCEAQWTLPWLRVQSQTDDIHWVCSPNAMEFPHLKVAPRKVKRSSIETGYTV